MLNSYDKLIFMKEFQNIHYQFIDNQKEFNTIVLPGFLQTAKSYEVMFQTISKYTNIYFIELPGFGITKALDKVVNLDYYVIYLNDFINTLKIKNVILVGHSFGGRVISKYEAIYHFAKSIILISPAGIKNKSIKTKFKILKYKLYKKVLKILHLKNKYQELIKNSGSSDYKLLDEISKQTFNNIIKEDTKKYLKKINIPTLLIWGKLDKTNYLTNGFKTNKLIKNSSLIIIEDAGHFPHLEKQVLVNNILDEFYKEVIPLIA